MAHAAKGSPGALAMAYATKGSPAALAMVRSANGRPAALAFPYIINGNQLIYSTNTPLSYGRVYACYDPTAAVSPLVLRQLESKVTHS